MDSFEIMQKYMQREVNRQIKGSLTKEEKEARQLVEKVQSCKIGFTYKEKAEACGIAYEEYMEAQRLIGKRY